MPLLVLVLVLVLSPSLVLLLWLSGSSVSRAGVGMELEALEMSRRRLLGVRGVSGTRGRRSWDRVGGWRSR